MTTGKTKALTIQTFVSKMMSLFFNMQFVLYLMVKKNPALFYREALSVVSKTVCCVNILEKIIQNKSGNGSVTRYAEMQEIQEKCLSPDR